MEPALVISHAAALSLIRKERQVHDGLTWEPVGRVEARQAFAGCVPERHLVDDVLLAPWCPLDGDAGENLDVLVGGASHRRRRDLLTCHVLSGALPAGALLKVEPGVYCCSPAFVALQYAKSKPLPEVVALLMELLGTYSMPPEATYPIAWGGVWPDDVRREAVEQAHYRCSPAVTPAELRAMARWAKSSSYATFRTAVGLVVPGSASPGETLMFGMLGLPLRHGGFGLCSLAGGMQLNQRVDFSHRAVLMSSGMSHAVCDAFIAAAKTDLEYNGVGHEEENYRIHDGQRNNGLRGMDIKVVVINRDQMRDIEALEAIAQSIYRDAGVQFRYRHQGYRLRQQALLNGLRQGIGLPPV